MAAGGTSGWKIFGVAIIFVLVAAGIGVAAFFLGRGCEEEEKVTTTTTRTQPDTAAPSDETGVEEETGGAVEPGTEEEEAPAGGEEPAERYVVGEGEGVTPCVGGFQTITRTTYWSDGSTDTTTTTVPCGP